MEIEEDRREPIAVLHCSGELVRATSSTLESETRRLLDAGIVKLVVDLSEVGFVDSSGLGVLIAARKRANQSGGQVMLSSPSEMVSNTLRIVRLDKVLGVYSSIEAAMVALKTSGVESP